MGYIFHLLIPGDQDTDGSISHLLLDRTVTKRKSEENTVKGSELEYKMCSVKLILLLT